MYVLFCKHFHVASMHCSHSKCPRKQEALNLFSWLGRPIVKPQGPQSQDPRSFATAAGTGQISHWETNMQQGIMGSHASPDLWISAEKIQDQQNSGAHFVMLGSAENIFFSAEIPGKTIEPAEVHYTKPEDEFRRTIGLNTKFRQVFFQQKSGTQFV